MSQLPLEPVEHPSSDEYWDLQAERRRRAVRAQWAQLEDEQLKRQLRS